MLRIALQGYKKTPRYSSVPAIFQGSGAKEFSKSNI
jgi:hypothetical protein